MKSKERLKDITREVKSFDPNIQSILNLQLKHATEQAAALGQCRIKFTVMWPTNSIYVKNLLLEYEDIIEKIEDCNCTPFNVNSGSYAELHSTKGSAIYLCWE